MPKFAVEVQYLVPVWTCIIVEADNADKAREAALENDDWEDAEPDYESSEETEVLHIAEITNEELETIGDRPSREQLFDFINSTSQFPDAALEEGTHCERAFGRGADIG
jgi:hypothetical protein